MCIRDRYNGEAMFLRDVMASMLETIPAGEPFEITINGDVITNVATVQQFVNELVYFAGVDAAEIERLEGELAAANEASTTAQAEIEQRLVEIEDRNIKIGQLESKIAGLESDLKQCSFAT